MKILYYTDSYAKNVMGTKTSIYNELVKRNHTVYMHDKSHIAMAQNHISIHKPDQIWLVHSGLKLSFKPNIPVIGFGMSDPYSMLGGKPGEWYPIKNIVNNYSVYITNHLGTFNKLKDKMPCIYNQTACDVNFHKNMNLSKTIDVSVIGRGAHLRWEEKNMRPEYVKKLRNCGVAIDVYGNLWPEGIGSHKHIEGLEFLQVINSSHLGLDIQNSWAPLAHRMLEYSACGTPCITRDREEVYTIFDRDEIITYTTFEDLRSKIEYYLSHKEELQAIADKAYNKVRNFHNVSNRVDNIISNLKKFGY